MNSNEIRNDIALIRLEKEAKLYIEDPTISNISPVCLPWSDYKKDEMVNFLADMDSLEGKNATITGWGKFTESIRIVNNIAETGAATGFLLVGNTPINNMECREDEKLKKFFDPNIHICAGSKDGK